MSTTKISIICALVLVIAYSALFYYNQSIEFKPLNQSTVLDQQTDLKNINEANDMDFSLGGLLGFFRKNNYIELNSYQNSCGGNMNGNAHSLKIKTIGDETMLTISKADWYYEPPKISEYIVDKNVLKEIEAIVNKYHMNRWQNKKFTDMFISDGETCSYYFTFKDHKSISFSSQIFPPKYSSKLKEIDNVIASYIKNGTKLPGLVLPKLSADELQEIYHNNKTGAIDLIIHSYNQNKLFIILKNGTKENLALPHEFTAKIYLGDKVEFESIVSITSSYDKTIEAESQTEKTIKIDHHLGIGTYKLEYGPFSTTFEIK